LGIPAIQILEAWEFPEYINVLLEKSQQYWEFPLYKYERCGNSQSILIFLQGIPIVHSYSREFPVLLGIPAIHILDVWGFPQHTHILVGNSHYTHIRCSGIPTYTYIRGMGIPMLC
jgi:hypothetical protein